MTTLAQARTDIVSGIRDHFDEDVVRTVVGHPGDVTLEEIERYTRNAPAVLVAPIGIPSMDTMGTVRVANVAWGAFCVTTKKSREAQNLVIVEQLLSLLAANNWDNDDMYSPTDVAARNLYGSAEDDHGISLWAVAWSQKMQLEPPTAVDLVDFLSLVNTWQYDDAEGSGDDEYQAINVGDEVSWIQAKIDSAVDTKVYVDWINGAEQASITDDTALPLPKGRLAKIIVYSNVATAGSTEFSLHLDKSGTAAATMTQDIADADTAYEINLDSDTESWAWSDASLVSVGINPTGVPGQLQIAFKFVENLT